MFLYSHRRTLSESFQQLGAPPGAYPPSAWFAGRAFSADWTPPAKNTPAWLTVRALAGNSAGANPVALDAQTAGYRSAANVPLPTAKLRPLLVRVETDMDRRGKRWGINREVQLGDADFDQRFYLETEMAEPLVKAVLAEPQVRAAITQLFALGVADVVLYDGPVLVTVRLRNPTDYNLALQGLQPLLACVAALAALLPHDAPSPRKRSTLNAALAVLLVTMVAMMGVVLPLLALDRDGGPVDGSIYGVGALLGLVLALAFAALLTLAVRGRSNALRIAGAALLVLLFAMPPAGAVTLTLLNSALDSSPAVRREATVLRRIVTHGKSTSYSVVLSPWAGRTEPMHFNVHYGLYAELSETDNAQLFTHAGFFGWEWYERLGPRRGVP